MNRSGNEKYSNSSNTHRNSSHRGAPRGRYNVRFHRNSSYVSREHQPRNPNFSERFFPRSFPGDNNRFRRNLSYVPRGIEHQHRNPNFSERFPPIPKLFPEDNNRSDYNSRSQYDNQPSPDYVPSKSSTNHVRRQEPKNTHHRFDENDFADDTNNQIEDTNNTCLNSLTENQTLTEQHIVDNVQDQGEIILKEIKSEQGSAESTRPVFKFVNSTNNVELNRSTTSTFNASAGIKRETDSSSEDSDSESVILVEDSDSDEDTNVNNITVSNVSNTNDVQDIQNRNISASSSVNLSIEANDNASLTCNDVQIDDIINDDSSFERAHNSDTDNDNISWNCVWSPHLIIIFNIPLSLQEQDLITFFERYGKILKWKFKYHESQGSNYCYIRFHQIESAANAIEANGLLFDDYMVQVIRCYPQKPVTCLFVRRCPEETTVEDIYKTFESCGPIQKLFIRIRKNRGKEVFLHFEVEESLKLALRLKKFQVLNKNVIISQAHSMNWGKLIKRRFNMED